MNRTNKASEPTTKTQPSRAIRISGMEKQSTAKVVQKEPAQKQRFTLQRRTTSLNKEQPTSGPTAELARGASIDISKNYKEQLAEAKLEITRLEDDNFAKYNELEKIKSKGKDIAMAKFRYEKEHPELNNQLQSLLKASDDAKIKAGKTLDEIVKLQQKERELNRKKEELRNTRAEMDRFNAQAGRVEANMEYMTRFRTHLGQLSGMLPIILQDARNSANSQENSHSNRPPQSIIRIIMGRRPTQDD